MTSSDLAGIATGLLSGDHMPAFKCREYRPCPVTVGAHNPPAHFRDPALMDGFVNRVNRAWEPIDDILAQG